MTSFFLFIKSFFKKYLTRQENKYCISVSSSTDQLHIQQILKSCKMDIQEQIIHRNGYIREAALDRLLKESHENYSSLIPFIISRMNDHVPVIRQKATLFFEHIFQGMSYEDVLAHHQLIDRFSETKHLKETDFLEKIYLKIKEIPRSLLLEVIKKVTPTVQIFILKAFLSEVEESEVFFVSVLKNISPITKRWLAVQLTSWALSSALTRRLLCDASSFLKQAVLRKIPQKDVILYKNELLKLMYDRTKRVRYLARFSLRSLDDIDIHQTYLRLIECRDHAPTGVILGFLEVATLQDAAQIKSYLAHETKSIRAAALVSLHAQSAPGTTAIIVQSLLDKSALVRSTAVKLAQKSPTSLENEVRTLILEAPDYAKGACFSLLTRRRNFQALLDVLTVLATAQHALEERAMTELKQWSIGHHASPNKALHENILLQIDRFEALQKPSYKAWRCDNSYQWERLKAEIKWIGYK